MRAINGSSSGAVSPFVTRLALLLILACSMALADRAVVPIRSIQPDDNNYADLRPLKKLIGSARIVQLGEPSHGDGATFLAKQRLIRFLHQEMGFRVLAWESGLFECEAMEKALRTSTPISEVRLAGLSRIWADGPHVLDVFHYARQSGLRMTGFDIQNSGAAKSDLAPQLFEFLARANPGLVTPENREALDDLIWSRYQPLLPEAEKRRAVVRTILEALPAASEGNQLYRRALQNVIDFDRQRWLTPKMPPTVEAENFRDQKMAENFLWLVDKRYPKEKIIVWAANMHVLRSAPAIETGNAPFNYRRRVTMGDLLHEKLGRQVYTIAFTAYSGEYGNPLMKEPRPLPPAPAGSLEAELHALGYPYAFVDFRKLPARHTLRWPIAGWPLGYLPMIAEWPKHFDAVFFTDRMFANAKTNGRGP